MILAVLHHKCVNKINKDLAVFQNMRVNKRTKF